VFLLTVWGSNLAQCWKNEAERWVWGDGMLVSLSLLEVAHWERRGLLSTGDKSRYLLCWDTPPNQRDPTVGAWLSKMKGLSPHPTLPLEWHALGTWKGFQMWSQAMQSWLERRKDKGQEELATGPETPYTGRNDLSIGQKWCCLSWGVNEDLKVKVWGEI
jgi:hypothetical protein